MLLKLMPNTQLGQERCLACRQRFETDYVLAEAYTQDHMAGFVCPDCLRWGEQRLRRLLLEQARSLEAQAALLRRETQQPIALEVSPDLKQEVADCLQQPRGSHHRVTCCGLTRSTSSTCGA